MRNLVKVIARSLRTTAITALATCAWAGEPMRFTSDADCTSKRLDRPPGVLANIGAGDQEGTRHCSSYTATQLIDALRLRSSSTSTYRSSAFALQVQYSARMNLAKLNDAPVLGMLSIIDSLPSCSNATFPDKLSTLSKEDFIFSLLQIYRRTRGPRDASEIATLVTTQTRSILTEQQAAAALTEPTWVKFFASFVADLCAKSEPVVRPSAKLTAIRSRALGGPEKAMEPFRLFINLRLDEVVPLPVGISYCRSVLQDKDSEGVGPDGTLNTTTCRGEVHASVIVGRRLLKYRSPGSKDVETICQFLVRDSYGISCTGYPVAEKDALPDASGVLPPVCERGQVWVDENALVLNANEVFQWR